MPADPARAKSRFLAAADLPATDRLAFLDRECGADADLRARVKALLRADEGPPTPVDATGAFDPSLATGDFAPDGATGTFGGSPARRERGPAAELGAVVAGRYTRAEVIGEGGMGTVFRATQTEPVKRRVALKLIKTGLHAEPVSHDPAHPPGVSSRIGAPPC